MAQYTLQMLPTGEVEVPGPEVYWMERFGEWEPLQFLMGLIRGDGKTILLNTGFPEEIEPLSEAWVDTFGERARISRPDAYKPENALRQVGVAPEEVDYVLVSPIQLYATGNLRLFPNAKLCFSRRGWIEDLVAPTYPHHVPRSGCISDEDFYWLLGEGNDRLVLLDDVEELLPGLTCRWIGVHHRSSFAVEVETAEGKAIVSDCAFHYANIEEGIPLGIAESIIEAHDAYDYIRGEADIFVPIYDPEVQSRHPEGKIA